MRGAGLDYRLYHDRTVTLRDTMMNLLNRRTRRELFTALDGVDLHVSTGEAVAVIGANGAGKSSFLKLLAGIYRPSRGTVEVGGSLASLLDLGVGFHPELTGEENLMLNGALLGLDRKRMAGLAPEIAEFAELTRFMDTPVKYYSAGMFMRLGFSLSTAVDPDILLIDEVLAVGDARFQEKCYDRIRSIRERGDRTMVFVSHDMEAVARLCTRAVWLDDGNVRMDGPVDSVLSEYLAGVQTRHSAASAEAREWGSMEVRLESVTLRNSTGLPSRTFRKGETMSVDALIRSALPGRVEGLLFGFSLHRPDGELVIGTNNLEMNRPLIHVEGETRVRLDIDLDVREPGTYLLGLAITDPRAGRDYHWQECFYPVTLLDERKEPPLLLHRADWTVC
jgi:ABC-type polysaccharide/polyol phosphate transport system ATPase subunit